MKTALVVILVGATLGAALGYTFARWYPFGGFGRRGHAA